MKKYQIWMEGFYVTGQRTGARLEAEIEADSFQEACDKHFNKYPTLFDYDSKNLRYWGCGLFDNETDARKTFG